MNVDVVVRDVRSFAGRQVIPVRPLTILIGENSTGKSTFLAILSALLDENAFPLRLSFNRSPYDLGNHDNIVNYARHKAAKTTADFAVGLVRPARGDASPIEAVATYAGPRGQIELSAFILKAPEGQFTLSAEGRVMTGQLHLQEDDQTFKFEFHAPTSPTPVDLYSFVMSSIYRNLASDTAQKRKDIELMQFRVWELIRQLDELRQSPYSVAPIRMKPKRTYDQTSDSFSPEGDHVPILLSRIFADDNSQPKEHLLKALRRFGEDSGLFSDLRVRRLGHKPTDPFQLKISTEGYSANLADVGYGVSQALPVVVQSVIASQAGVLLMQQPEVHLHPRGQAALGTFFAELVATEHKSFVIETHSDYLVDRIRQEVAAKRLDPASVALLFFSRNERGTKIKRIEIDSLGNLVSAPFGYRNFFLREQERLLLRGED